MWLEDYTLPDDTVPAVLAIDPGSAKCGIAVTRPDGVILARDIVAPADLLERVRALLQTYRPLCILIGGGTGSKPLIVALRNAEMPVPICVVDEAYTSEEARARFVRETPPCGWQRLLPQSLRTPWCPYDDYVAIILAERYWREEALKQKQKP